LTDLTDAMRSRVPAYAAFGNKEALFRKALDLYEREKLDYIGKALEKPTARRLRNDAARAIENVVSAAGRTAAWASSHRLLAVRVAVDPRGSGQAGRGGKRALTARFSEQGMKATCRLISIPKG
jgi:hypothetical protein